MEATTHAPTPPGPRWLMHLSHHGTRTHAVVLEAIDADTARRDALAVCASDTIGAGERVAVCAYELPTGPRGRWHVHTAPASCRPAPCPVCSR